MGQENEHFGYKIQVDIEKWLLDDTMVGYPETQNLCYLPIFVVPESSYPGAYSKWFLGNIVMNDYMVVHDFDITERKMKDNIRYPL